MKKQFIILLGVSLICVMGCKEAFQNTDEASVVRKNEILEKRGDGRTNINYRVAAMLKTH